MSEPSGGVEEALPAHHALEEAPSQTFLDSLEDGKVIHRVPWPPREEDPGPLVPLCIPKGAEGHRPAPTIDLEVGG